MEFQLVLGVSARHLHLCRADMDALFGAGSELTVKKIIGQPGQFAADQQVLVHGPKSSIKLRIIGPLRPETQIELSMTDARGLGVAAPIRNSGDVAGTPGIILEGPAGKVELPQGVIVAARHVHLCPATAEKYGLKDGDIVDIRTEGQRSLTLHNVLVRAGEKHADEVHIDTDEANACQLDSDAMVTIVCK